MYITETTDNVRELFNKLEDKEDITKLKFLIYIFDKLNNDQINSKNEVNPNLIEDDDLVIFNFMTIGFSSNVCTVFLQYLVMFYNSVTKTNDLIEKDGNIIGLEYDEIEKKLISDFEELSFSEKLDVFSEIIIRYDNETYFKEIFKEMIIIVTFDSKSNGYDIAKLIKDYKQQLNI